MPFSCNRVVIDAMDVSKSYSGRRVVKDFSIRLSSGQVHGLLGPNGSGKTTILHILTGLIKPDRGAIVLSGTPITAKESRQYLGFAPDDLALPEMLTGAEYIEFIRAMRVNKGREITKDLVYVLGIGDVLDEQISKYSHGMKRKIQLVTALAHQPSLLVLDEPFRGLDPDAAAVLRSLIRDFARRGNAVLIATHDMIRAEKECHEVTIIHQGKAIATGAPVQLIKNSSATNLEEVFLTTTKLKDFTAKKQKIISQMFDFRE